MGASFPLLKKAFLSGQTRTDGPDLSTDEKINTKAFDARFRVLEISQ